MKSCTSYTMASFLILAFAVTFEVVASNVRNRLEELISIAKSAPLKVPEEELPTKKEVEVKPFHREYLVGKWYSRTKTYTKEWSAYKTAPIKIKETMTEHETIYEFMDNGSFIKTHRFVIHDETSPNDGKWQETKDSGSWNYSESEGDIVLIVDKASSSFKRSMGQAHIQKTSIIWFSENNMVIRSRKDKANKGNIKSDKRKSESSWCLDKYGCMHHTFSCEINEYYKYSESISLPFHLTRISVSPSEDPKSLYRIMSLEREPKNIFGYHFVLELTSAGTRSSSVIQQILREFRSMIKSEYVETYSVPDSESLVVDFPEYTIKDGKIEGRGVVIAMSVVSLNYNPNTRQGRLGIRMSPNQFETARKYVRKNIETLARDKNIALTTGEIPPAAKFYLGREELKDGNVLEIEFRTE